MKYMSAAVVVGFLHSSVRPSLRRTNWKPFLGYRTSLVVNTIATVPNHDVQQKRPPPPPPWRDTGSSLSLERMSSPPSIRWTVCCKCHGEGRRHQRSRKARRTRKDDLNNKSDDCPNVVSPSEQTVSVTICKVCQGSGLQQQQQQQQPAESSDTGRRPIRIAVIGGGIGGLALAAACQHRNISVTVYERDTHFHQRKQGYGLTLQQASKQLMGLGIVPANLTSTTAPGITSTKHIVHDEMGNVKGTWGLRHWLGENETTTTNNNDFNNSTHSEEADPMDASNSNTQKAPQRRRQNIHIARQALRHELFLAATANECAVRKNTDSTVDSIIKWNHHLLKYDEMENGVALTFAVSGENQSPDRTVTEYADIVVGADGIRSQVRQQFFGSENDAAQLRYLNCIVILGICPLSELDKDVRQSTSFGHLLDGQTVFQTADGVTRIYMMPYSKTEYMWQLSFPCTESDATDLSARGSVALREVALSKCRLWHTPIPDILQSTPIDLVTGYPVYDRELVQPHQLQRPDHPHSRRITFIGDAIHCMSPFKGQGANQALLDALSLARCLYKSIRMAEKQSSIVR